MQRITSELDGSRLARLYKDQDAFLNKFYRRLVRALPGKPTSLRNRGPIVSFTFDDFPSSAIRIGGPILRDHDVRATYYVSLGRMRPHDAVDDGASFTADDVREVVAQGHELACHTYSHADCPLTRPESLARELDRNAAAMAEIVPGYRFTNFAYPYGNVDLASKRLLGKRFDTARGIWTGINIGRPDFSLLSAHRLYGGEAMLDQALHLIAENRRSKGWLIFFTHDVRPSPSAYGSTPEQLDRVLRAARDSGCGILTMRDAVAAAG